MARYGPGDQLDSYRIEDLLGAGAYAETYRATDGRDGREVVLKVPDPNLFADPAIFNRYQREAEVAKRLDHPGVQSAIETGDGRTDYLVLQYIDGESLRDRLHTRRGPLPIETVVDWGEQLATALAYLHRQGIVHRDLEARERAGSQGRPAGGHRLRDRPAGRRPPPHLEAPFEQPRHPGVHEPGAGPGGPGR